ncbi:MAG: GspH/FimT family pseudopilin [Luteimonas sp.]
MERRQHGFSLIEALIAMTLIAIGLAIAVPSYSNVAAATHMGTARVALAESLLGSLNHATITETEVVLCSSSDGAACSGSVDWSRGWIAFADIDGNRVRGPNETLLRRQATLEGGTHIRSTAQRTRIVFQPHGGATAGSNVTFTLCDARGPDKATTIVLANSGRMRQGLPTPAAATACVYSS